jgi:hypothetical protein
MTESPTLAEPQRLRERLRESITAMLDSLAYGAGAATALALLDALARAALLDPPTSRAILWLVAGIGPELTFRLIPNLMEGLGTPWLGAIVPLAIVAALLPWHGAMLLGRITLGVLFGAFAAAIVLVGYLELGAVVLAGLLALASAAAIAHRRYAVSLRTAAVSAAALAFIGGVAAFAGGQRAAIARARAHGPSGTFVTSVVAYDLIVLTDAPADAPDLVFSTQGELYTIELGEPPRVIRQDWAGQGWWERFSPSDDPARPFAADPGNGVFKLDLAARVTQPFNAPFGQRPACLDYDPQRGWLLVANEWFGQLVSYDVARGEVVVQVDRSPYLGTAPWLSRDGDRLFLSSMLGDGDLQVLALDDELRELDRVRNLFVYHTVVDRERGLLWAGRPLYGELLALELDSLEVVTRLQLTTGPRDLVIDEATGQLFVNTYPAGELFRIDLDRREILERGWCGWRCRSLAIDPQRRLLWAASRDGVMAIALDAPFGSRS